MLGRPLARLQMAVVSQSCPAREWNSGCVLDNGTTGVAAGWSVVTLKLLTPDHVALLSSLTRQYQRPAGSRSMPSQLLRTTVPLTSRPVSKPVSLSRAVLSMNTVAKEGSWETWM